MGDLIPVIVFLNYFANCVITQSGKLWFIQAQDTHKKVYSKILVCSCGVTWYYLSLKVSEYIFS